MIPRLLLAEVCAAVLFAQAPKRPLNHKDYDSWRSISSAVLSRDGRYLAYGLFPQAGDGQLVVRDLKTGQERRELAGSLPPPPLPDPAAEPEEGPPRRPSIRIAFTADGRYLVSSTFPPQAETDKARKERKRPEEMPKGGLIVMDLGSAAVARIADVKTFQVPERAGDWVAYLKEPKPAERPAEKKDNARGARPRAARPEFGSQLVLRDLARPEPNERSFEDVLDYSASKDGRTLVYTVGSRKEEQNGFYTLEVAGAAKPVAVLSGKGKYAKPTWSRAQDRLAFLSSRDDAAARPARFKVYLWDRKTGAAAEAVSTATPGFRAGFVIGERATLQFSRDGSRLFVGASPAAADTAEETPAAPADDKVLADLWHWKDDYIQPMQKIRAVRERNRTYTGALRLADKKFVQLGGPEMQGVIPSDDGRFALGVDDRPYRRLVDFDAAYSDYYVVDTGTGVRRRIIEKQRGGGGPVSGPQVVAWEPDGRYVLYFRDRQWRSVNVPDGRETNLTAGLNVPFHNEDDDRPEPPSPYGNAGWTRDSRWVLLYDRYDVWQVAPDGQGARNLTAGVGRQQRLQFRVVRLESEEEDQEERGIEPAKPVLLRAENLETRDSGFWRDRIGSGTPQRLIMAAKNFRTLGKAKDADVILLTATTFREQPDLQVTDSGFRELRRVSDANPQMAGLLWGTAELIRYRNADGVPLQGALFKPDGFDPNRKYPLMVYIYERLSQTLNNFVEPRPNTSINISYYVSNGYLVLEPDIVYTTGAPGQSALKCVLPAIQAVVDKGFVNENAIGIQGHSWGGYQVAYLVGHTTRFRAAEAGAPVANMTSAYNGIRWGSGLPRQFQYEQSQSRIGGTLWQAPLLFIENSPIFTADRIQTPLLILHDDQDDAVPWYQGIELFLSLRRLGKEAYLWSYNGEFHGLRRRQNQQDYTIRMQQFFDHFLKSAPAPEWMEKGVPYLDREKEKERFQAGADGR